MPVFRKPLYQRADGADDDRWRLAFDTDAGRLFIEHEITRGDSRGQGYSTWTEDVELTAFLNERGNDEAQRELMVLLARLFEERDGADEPKARALEFSP